MSDEQQQFLDQVLADPYNDEPRLVYADWLLDRDDPRGEFIQLQCAREQLPEFSAEAFAMRQRERELLREHAVQWAGDLEHLLYRYVFRRGFIEWGRVNPDRFLATAPQLFQLTPLKHVMLARGTVDKRFADCSELSRLESLCFSKCLTRSDHLLSVLSSPHTENIRSLGFAELDEVPVRRVFALKPHLESFYVTQCQLRGWNAWLDKVDSPNLRSLRVKGGNLQEQVPHAFRSVCESPLSMTLEEFGFCEWDNRLADLHRLNGWPRLVNLEISMPSASAVMKVAESSIRLSTLSLENYGHRNMGLPPNRFRRLLESPILSKLNLLRVHGTVSDDHAMALANWPRLAKLSRLNLESNSMTVDGIRMLLHAIPAERHLICDLRGNGAGDHGIRQLLDEFGPHLKKCLIGAGAWYLGDTQGRDWSGENLTLI